VGVTENSALHLGLTPWLAPIGRSAAELVRQAELAEGWGYESFWLPENHFGEGAIPDPLMLLAAVAGATQTIRLATTSFLLPLRHPIQAAEQVAVLDQLSNGRVILGVGRGFQPAMFDAFNVPPQQKRARFEACLQDMRDAWAGASVGSDPEEPIVLSPLPVQQPHPPVWVAAFGPKALAQVGGLGLPYLASPMESRQTLEANYALHRQACADSGHDAPVEVPIMRTVFVSNEPREIERVRTRLERQAQETREQANASIARRVPEQVDDWALIGSPLQVGEAIAEYRETLGMTHLVATRLRISSFQDSALERSLQLLADLPR
jgi:alkanesulfonate monooxygenase SsuD/methylene tetrahydromethanopterin reductase-like flavin-dependent oxidoreductase (luciferase family)